MPSHAAGAIAALQTIVTFVAPLVMSPIYAATEQSAPGLVFLLMTGLAVLAAAVAYTLPNLEEIGKPKALAADGAAAAAVMSADPEQEPLLAAEIQ